MPIDNTRWAITLIDSGESSVLNPKTWAGHAAIIIEGRKKGAFFKHKAHLRRIEGVAKVLLYKNLIGEISYNEKGETWKVDCLDATKMIQAIKWEKRKEEEGDPQIFFDIRGAGSKLVKPIFIREYASLYDLFWQQFGIEYFAPSPASRYPTCKSIILKDREGRQWKETKGPLEIDEHYASPQQVFIQNQADEKWTEVRIPDNCLTWAKRKLEECGIYLEGDTLNALYAAPKRYLVKGPGLQDNFMAKIGRLPLWGTIEEKKELTPLMQAIVNSNVSKVEKLLSKRVDPCAKNTKGLNALHIACMLRDFRIVKLLNEKGMDINKTAEDGSTTPLRSAILTTDEEFVEFLLKLGANVDQQDVDGNSALHFLIYLHILSAATPLERVFSGLPYQFLVNLKIPEILLRHCHSIDTKNNLGETPLTLAAKGKQNRLARLFLQNKAAVDETDKEGRTALWYACSNNDIEMVRLLIEYDTDLLAAYRKILCNPFKIVHEKKFKVIKHLMKKALAEQARKNHCVVSRDHRLHRHSRRHTLEENEDLAALMSAIKNGDTHTVKELLVNGVDPKVKNKDGYNPLHVACKEGNFEIVKLLFEKGMDINLSFGFFRHLGGVKAPGIKKSTTGQY